MKTVWLVMERYDTGAGPRADRYIGTYAHGRDASAVVMRRVAAIVHRMRETDPEQSDYCDTILKRTHCWYGLSVAVYCNHDCYGYSIIESKVIESLCSCGHGADDTVPGRDEGYVACANCGMQ